MITRTGIPCTRYTSADSERRSHASHRLVTRGSSAIVDYKALRHVVLTRDHTVLPATRMFIHNGMNHTCLYSPVPSHPASPHFDRYSFSVTLRVEGGVGLSG